MAESPLAILVEESNPQILDDLRKRHPGASDLLGTSRTRAMRDATAEIDNVQNAEPSIIAAKIDLLLQGIDPVRVELDAIVSVVFKKMKKAKNTKTFGAVVATLSGMVIATSEALNLGEEWIKVVSATFATVGGLVVILSDHFAQAPSGKHIASAEEYGTLRQMDRELFKLEKRVERHKFYPLSQEDLLEMTNSLDEYAAHINGLILKKTS